MKDRDKLLSVAPNYFKGDVNHISHFYQALVNAIKLGEGHLNTELDNKVAYETLLDQYFDFIDKEFESAKSSKLKSKLAINQNGYFPGLTLFFK